MIAGMEQIAQHYRFSSIDSESGFDGGEFWQFYFSGYFFVT